MIIAYIAGPYTGQTKGHGPEAYMEIEDNINKARFVAAWCAENGIGFFCPHMNSQHFEVFVKAPVDFWYEMDYTFLNTCDVLLVQGQWKKSKGTVAEVEYAREHNIPVLFFDKKGDRNKLLKMAEEETPLYDDYFDD